MLGSAEKRNIREAQIPGMLGNSVAEKPSMCGPREMKVTLLFGIATCVTSAMAQHPLSGILGKSA